MYRAPPRDKLPKNLSVEGGMPQYCLVDGSKGALLYDCICRTPRREIPQGFLDTILRAFSPLSQSINHGIDSLPFLVYKI
jgi:hypothetical protein